MEPGEAYIQLPDPEPGRALYAGTIAPDTAPGYLYGEFSVRRRTIDPGTELLLYHAPHGRFAQQWVVVESAEPRGPTIRLRLACVSQPMSAESRQWQRVPAMGCGAVVRLAGAPAELMDVGVTGVSVCSGAIHTEGDLLETSVAYKERVAMCRVEVRTAVAMPEGDWHYGLLCVDEHGTPSARGFGEIYLELMRDQRSDRHTR
jgi:hypothetical protein